MKLPYTQVRNHYSKNTKDAHIESTCIEVTSQSLLLINVLLQTTAIYISHYRWILTLISFVKQDQNIDQQSSDDAGEVTGAITSSFDIDQDDFDYYVKVSLLIKAGGNKMWQSSKDSVTNNTEPFRCCNCMPTSSKLLHSSCGNGPIMAQIPKVYSE